MADLSDIQAAGSTKIIGSDATGLENTPVNATSADYTLTFVTPREVNPEHPRIQSVLPPVKILSSQNAQPRPRSVLVAFSRRPQLTFR
jgi:hypothetical protein